MIITNPLSRDDFYYVFPAIGQLRYQVKGNTLHIYNMEVDEEFRRKGIMTKCIKKAMKAHNCDKVIGYNTTQMGAKLIESLNK